MDGQPYMGRTFSFFHWYAGYLCGIAPRYQLRLVA